MMPLKDSFYPLLFDKSSSSLDHPLEIVIDWSTLFTSVRYISLKLNARCDIIVPNMDKQPSRKELNDCFISSGILFGVQHVFDTIPRHLFESFLGMGKFTHLLAIGLITSQYGLVDWQPNGIKMNLPSYYEQLSRGIRAANQVLNHDQNINYGNLESLIRSTCALPASVGDETFDLILLSRLQDWCKSRRIGINNFSKWPSLLKGEKPDWWTSIPDEFRPDIEPLFKSRPKSQAEWVSWLNSLNENWFFHSKMPLRPTGIGTYVESDLDFNGDRKQQFQEIKSKWEMYLPGYSKYNLIDNSELPANGSVCQISKVDTVSTIKLCILTTLCPVSYQEASLCAIFPSLPYYTEPIRFSKSYHCEKVLEEAKHRWVHDKCLLSEW